MARSSKKGKSQRQPGRKKILLRGQINDLFTHKRIQITLAQAKKLRPEVEPIITGFRKRVEKNFDHASRMAFAKLHNKKTVQILAKDILPAVGDRNGGYLRIIRTGIRKGDASEMADIELVDFNSIYKKGSTKRSATRRRRKKSKVAQSQQKNPAGAIAETVVGASDTGEMPSVKKDIKTLKITKEAVENNSVVPENKGQTVEPGGEKSAKASKKDGVSTKKTKTDA